ncbi:MAG: hypothetical protein ABW203_03565 [Novosphingobium sp.]
MVWDLRAALLRKEEFETARLIDFDFRLRARTFRLLADILDLPRDEWAQKTVLAADDALLDRLAHETGRPREELSRLHRESRERARRRLIETIGDPTPVRLG